MEWEVRGIFARSQIEKKLELEEAALFARYCFDRRLRKTRVFLGAKRQQNYFREIIFTSAKCLAKMCILYVIYIMATRPGPARFH